MTPKELVVSISKTEYMKSVFEAGADAVCLRYRSFCEQHGDDCLQELARQVGLAHSLSKKLYFAFDFFAHNEDIDMLKGILTKLSTWTENVPDALVVYDPGVFNLVKSMLPQVAIHIGSTINVTNDSVCDIWKKLGASRVQLAHVLSADAAIKIACNHSETVEIEAFIYGVPCISYSGRRLLSGFLEECNVTEEPTRYSVMEEQRQGEYYIVEQDARGTYVFDAKTRDWLKDIDNLAQAGVTAFGIEGMAYNEQQLIEAVKLCKQAIDIITV